MKTYQVTIVAPNDLPEERLRLLVGELQVKGFKLEVSVTKVEEVVS